MKHLTMYESDNQDLYDLMGDLASLGITRNRAYLQLYTKQSEGRYVENGFYELGKLIFNNLDTLKRKITMDDIVNALSINDFTIEINHKVTKYRSEGWKKLLKMSILDAISFGVSKMKRDPKFIPAEEKINLIVSRLYLETKIISEIELFIDDEFYSAY